MRKPLLTFYSALRRVTRRMKGTASTIPKENQRPEFIDHKRNIVYGGDVSSPTPNQSVGTVLFNRLKTLSRGTILQVLPATEQIVTVDMFLEETVALALKLSEVGIKRGDYVLLIGDNTLNMNVALIGTFFLAAVPVPLSPKTDREEFITILRGIKPSFFGCDSLYMNPFMQILVEAVQFDPSNTFLLDQETTRDIAQRKRDNAPVIPYSNKGASRQ